MNKLMNDTVSTKVMSSPFIQWVTEHWILAIIIVVVAFALLFFVILPLIFKLINRSKKVAETAELKNDLMAWKNLSELVRGGKKEQAAKRKLSSQLKLIKLLFRQGLDMFKTLKRNKYDVPWFISLGEPHSGKSALFEHGELELVCSASGNLTESDKKSLPLCCWLGAKSFVIDISGTIFFDRWLNGSSAEWNYVVDLICKQYKKRAIAGIVLVIPADALLSDNVALTRQKASLIASELHYLFVRSKMNIPCHIVVSKMDMVLGFREYFSQMTSEERERIFGWQNAAGKGELNSNSFEQYWSELYKSLQSNFSKLSSNSDLYNRHNVKNRLTTTANIYLFADNFMKIKESLDIYLRTIFSQDGCYNINQALLSGVFFTSAKDSGVTLSQEFANINNKSVDEAVLFNEKPSKTPFFIKKLFSDFIFGKVIIGSFTSKERFKREFPYYILTLLILCAGALSYFIPTITRGELKEHLNEPTEYYKNIKPLFSDGLITEAALIGIDDSNKPVLFMNKSVNKDYAQSRLQLLYDGYNYASNRLVVSPVFWIAAMADFDLNVNLARRDRERVFSQMKLDMLFLPTIKSSKKYIIANKDNIEKKETFTKLERNAMFEFVNGIFYNNHVDKNIDIDSLLKYLFDGKSFKNIDFITNTNTPYKLSSKMPNLLVYDVEYQQASELWIDQFYDAWSRLDIYPDSLYQRLKVVYGNCNDLLDKQKKIEGIVAKLPTDQSELQATLVELDSLIAKQNSDVEKIKKDILDFTDVKNLFLSRTDNMLTVSKTPIQESEVKLDDSKNHVNFLALVSDDFKSLLKKDREDIQKYISRLSNLDIKRSNKNKWNNADEKFTELFTLAEHSLSNEREDLDKQLATLISNKLFYIHADEKLELLSKDLVNYTSFAILAQINNIILQINEQDLDKVKNIDDLAKTIDKIDLQINTANKSFDTLSKTYAEDKLLADQLSCAKKILEAKITSTYYRAVDVALEVLPNNSAKLESLIKGQEKEPYHLDLPSKFYLESIGPVDVLSTYNPNAIKPILETIVKLNDFINIKKNKKLIDSKKQESMAELSSIFAKYLGEYINYWGSYVDLLAIKSSSWQDFNKLSKKLKPYEVNTMLQLAYNNSANNLSMIPNDLLDKDLLKKRDDQVKQLNDKIKLINGQFTTICIMQLSAWSLLPSSADKAYFTLKSTLPKLLLANYLTLIQTGNNGEIPWWSNTINNALQVLKTDAGKSLLATINNNSSKIFNFPICADSINSEVLSIDDLEELYSTLNSLGFTSLASAKDATDKTEKKDTSKEDKTTKDPLDALQLNEDISEDMLPWGNNLVTVVDALTNDKKPLVWTLSIPDVNEQKVLTSSLFPDMVAAIYRYRYANLMVNNKTLGELHSLDEAKSIEFGRGSVMDSDIEIQLYEFIEDKKPVAKVTYHGLWSILRLYLTAGSYVEPKSNLLYIPLIIKDKADANSILWVSLKFNKILPDPANWPRIDKWPEFSQVQKENRSSRVIPKSNWKNIIGLSKSYDDLKDMLLKHNLKSYPNLKISLGDQSEDTKKIMNKYRYVELFVPGKAAKRVLFENGAELLSDLSLTAPGLTLRLFQYSSSEKVALEFSVAGPYAPLRLLTAKDRKQNGGTFDVNYEFKATNNTQIKLLLKLQLLY